MLPVHIKFLVKFILKDYLPWRLATWLLLPVLITANLPLQVSLEQEQKECEGKSDLISLGGFYNSSFHKLMRKEYFFSGCYFLLQLNGQLTSIKRSHSQILGCRYLFPSLCPIPIPMLIWTYSSKLNLLNWQRNKYPLLKTEKHFFLG